jgi:hypothetical protein
MQKIDELPQFDVQRLLEGALRKLEAANLGGPHGGTVEAAGKDVLTVLAAHANIGDRPTHDAEQTLRRAAKSLAAVSDLNVESARLAIMSAADMLRSG